MPNINHLGITRRAILRLALTLLASLSFLPAIAYDFEVNGLYFEIISFPDRTCKLTSGEITYSGSLIIPSSVTYEGLEFSVTEVYWGALNRQITELSIPGTINTLPKGTLSRCQLSRLIICDSESELNVEDYVEYAESGYWQTSGPTYKQPLEYLYIGRNLTGRGYFEKHQSLTTIEIGKYVTLMPGFYNCNKIEEVFIPDNVTTLPGAGFEGCENIKTIYIGNGVTAIPNYYLNGAQNLETVYIGSNVSEMGWNTFNQCSKLSKLYIFSNNLITMDDPETSVKIPKTTAIFVPDPNKYADILDGYYVDKLIDITETTSEYTGFAPIISSNNNVSGASVEFPSTSLNSSVGTYNTTVDIQFAFENGWRVTTAVPASYTITKAPLTVIANNITRQYGMDNPELTCSFFGFKNDDNAEVLTKLPKLETTATATSPVGTYPIVATGAEAQNYSFIYDRGTLTITKADQQIDWTQTFEEAKVGDAIKLEASSTSGLPVKYSVTDETVASIYSESGTQYVEILKPGTLYINATQAGNENYNEAEKVSKKITVTPIEPETPENPSQPETPENPDKPDTPDQPDTPDTPVNPGNPENPDKPVTPDDPEKPTNPDEPATPENPDNPDNPDEPVDPDKPTDPDQPTDPENPANPDQPTDPEQPENPGDDDNTDSINDVAGDAGISVSAYGGIIVVNAPDSVKIEVYTITGTLLRSTRDHRIGGLSRGIYIVRIGNRSFKIAL